ncbi:peroxidase, FMP-type [Flavobacterium hydatis]|uniref:Uncharacterized protein n=1 Tax=Flavobacterium hydatis TaxID=991 RepID=A0A085ZWR9_FLAHY|nr:peroxidase, FMP-type [Flavobacterium hydatis]KFF08883.1 hypothetical protein IW20_23390 [Flavobacterium hydatis]OXA95830.1 hypothetical protein B0A62_07560 [Flavobacterium hydatis]
MFKRKDPTEGNDLFQASSFLTEKGNDALLRSAEENKKDILFDLMSGYEKVQINDPIRAFHESDLENIGNNVKYGVLKVLEGTWVSYKNNNYNELSKNKLIGSGIHTTIMPSPGTNLGTIPGKYSFDCEEYIEKLTFNLVEGGVRNRGGANEQFCGAVKYEQSIKSVNRIEGETALKYTPIHEENGMYLWLSDIFNHAATEKSIKEDRGLHPIEPDDKYKDLYKSGYKDEILYLVTNADGKNEYVTQENLNGREYSQFIPAKELKPGDGQKGPYFIPDYSISRSGVIPHGSTITLLGDLVQSGPSCLNTGAPNFPKGLAAWDFDHLSISRTMGGADAKANPIDLDKPAPDWVTQKLDKHNDPRENKIYSQRILAHHLYPYSVRPDLRLRDSIKGEVIKDHVHIQMSSKNKTGAQGGILNVPFVNRFAPTVEMNMQMWVETVIENGKEILQLQYEQVILFEFHFGDDGGTTSWPHIQINTLRKIEDVSEEQRLLIDEQFNSNKIKSSGSASECPYQKQ